METLQRLQQRLAGTAEERHAFLYLRRLRRPLEEEDVGQWMSGADHRDVQLVAVAPQARRRAR